MPPAAPSFGHPRPISRVWCCGVLIGRVELGGTYLALTVSRHVELVLATGFEACALLRSIDVRDNLLDDLVRMVAQLGGLKRLERIDARQNPFSRHFTG